MLTRLKLRNFKPWANSGDIRLRPITGLFGTNSSGKTSLLQALLLLMQTADSSDRGAVFHFGGSGGLVDLGDFRSTVHGHADHAEMEVSLDWRADEPFRVFDTKNGENVLSEQDLGFTVVVRDLQAAARSPRVTVQTLAYRVGDAVFGIERKSSGKINNAYELFCANTTFQFNRSQGRPWPLPAPVKSYGFPDQVRAFFQNAGFLTDLELALETRLDDVFYLGPLRASPGRRYDWAGEQPPDVGHMGEDVIAALLAARERGQKISPGPRRRKRTLEAHVAHWLKRLGLIHDFRVDRIGGDSHVYQVKVRKTPTSAEVLITDVGFGVSQILPVLVLCFYVPEGSTIILEQPEIHLHPAVQSGLADVLIDAWQNRKVQIVLESHSEHLLRRLQRRIAEDTVHRDDVGLFFCRSGAQGATITPLALDVFGNVTNWPADFFGDEFGEMAAMTKAAQERRREAAP